jgi:hypothetical protein
VIRFTAIFYGFDLIDVDEELLVCFRGQFFKADVCDCFNETGQ